MKASLVITVYNEEKTIIPFLDSITSQSKKPYEVIIVDGGSKDKTVEIIKDYKKIKVVVFEKKGNRSVGRNEGISKASGDIIVISDSGCILDKNWISEITKPFTDKKTEVVAGYYEGKANTLFQKCLVPYVLVMPDKLDNEYFLPASRSMALRKKVWKKLGGFPQEYSHNEDYVFAKTLEKHKIKISFAKGAIVYWIPRTTFWRTFVMFARFAFGDGEAGIFRQNVFYIYYRYSIVFYLSVLLFITKSLSLAFFLSLSVCLYVVWSIWKNYKYVNKRGAFFYLPAFQVISDLAVILGTTIGATKRFFINTLPINIRKNMLIVTIFFVYVLLMISVLKWGIPGISHPFAYHMDEWHQLQSVRHVFKYGTPNIAGGANGSMLQFFISGVYLIPFVLLKIINPFSIKSAIDLLPMQERIFEILRFNTLLFGILSVLIMLFISNRLKISKVFCVLLFVFNPAFLSLSNYFKYDIALLFWISLFLYLSIRFIQEPSKINYVVLGTVGGLALSTKVSAIPLIPIYIFIFFQTYSFKKSLLPVLGMGLLMLLATFGIFGLPDLLFFGQNMNEYISSNVLSSTAATQNFYYGDGSLLSFFIFQQFPTIFGHPFFVLILVSLLCWLFNKEKNVSRRVDVFLIVSLILFAISFQPLGIYIGANRALVLLPWMIIFICLTVKKIFAQRSYKLKKILMPILVLVMLLQIIESGSWIILKYTIPPQALASDWIYKNIKKGETIGIENIPVYQATPDFILYEFYKKNINNDKSLRYSYIVIDSKIRELPNIVIVSNPAIAKFYEKKSIKKELINNLEKRNYKKIAEFFPSPQFYKLFGNELNYYMSGLVAGPDSIAIYAKPAYYDIIFP